MWSPALNDLSGVTSFDDPAAIGGPSSWTAAGGELEQTSAIGDPSGTVLAAGTWAAGGDAGADDVRISVRLGSDGGAIGAMFRVRDANNYYRVSLDAATARRRLVKVAGGTATVLWEDTTQGYTTGAWHRLTIDAVGASLRASLDGVALFTVIDYDLQTGRAAVYASGANTARFDSIAVLNLDRRAGNWRLRDDDGAAAAPSQLVDRGRRVHADRLDRVGRRPVPGYDRADRRTQLRRRARDRSAPCRGPSSDRPRRSLSRARQLLPLPARPEHEPASARRVRRWRGVDAVDATRAGSTWAPN